MTTTYSPNDYNLFIGIDVDKNKFSFTVKDHNLMKLSKTIPSNPEQFYNYVQKHFYGQRVLCGYEAGPTGFDFYDYLTEKDLNCLVISPASIPKPPNQKVKTNRIDSEKITNHLRSGDLQSIRVPHGNYRELRHLVNLRDIYVYQRKATKQRIKSLLLYVHLDHILKDVEQNWSGHYIEQLKQLSCSYAVRQRLDMLLNDLSHARSQNGIILRKLREFCKNDTDIYKYTQYLQSIPGIGFIAAVTLLGRIGNPQLLQNPRELAAFIGLVPKEHSTGDDVYRGSITRLGNTTLRHILIEAAWVTIRYNTELNQFYHRIKARHHPKIASQKAIVAVARKLTQIIYCVLKEQRTYIIHK